MSVLEKMRTAGFTKYEAEAYVCLVRHGDMTASELSKASGIPYSKTYEVFGKLEEKGLIEVQKGRPMIFRAVPPRIALRRYRKERLQRLEMEHSKRRQTLEERHKEQVSKISEALIAASEELQGQFDKGGTLTASDDLIWTIRGAENVISQMRELIVEASTLKMILPGELLGRLEKEIMGTGGRGEIILQDETPRRFDVSGNFRVYWVERIPFKCGVLIADGARTIFTSEGFEMGFKSSNPGLAIILNHFFEHEKEEAKSA